MKNEMKLYWLRPMGTHYELREGEPLNIADIADLTNECLQLLRETGQARKALLDIALYDEKGRLLIEKV